MKHEPLQFHFSCYALCEIELGRDRELSPEDFGQPINATLRGFWTSASDADLAARGFETQARAEHEAQYKRGPMGRWPAWPFDDPGYRPRAYEIVPLSAVRFRDLWSLNQAIEEAAKARRLGLGKEISHA